MDIGKVTAVDPIIENSFGNNTVFTEVISDQCFIKRSCSPQKIMNVLHLLCLWLFSNEAFWDEIVNSIFRLQIKLDCSLKHFILDLSRPLELVHLAYNWITVNCLVRWLIILIIRVRIINWWFSFVRWWLRYFSLSDLEFCILSLNGFVYIPQHLNKDLNCIQSQRIFFLWSYDIWVLTFLKFSLSYLREWIYHPFKDVLLLLITIIVNEYL